MDPGRAAGHLSLGLNLLIASLRTGRAAAERGEARAAQLHQLAQTLAACEGAEAGAIQAAQWLSTRLGHTCAVFVRAAQDQPPACYAATAPERFQPRAIEWAMEHGRCAGRGCPDWPDLPVWCAPFSRRQSMGGVQVLLAPSERPDADTLEHWQALVRQVGLSVERERAAAAARQAQDQAQSEATRNTLLASLSHDLRTPQLRIDLPAAAPQEPK